MNVVEDFKVKSPVTTTHVLLPTDIKMANSAPSEKLVDQISYCWLFGRVYDKITQIYYRMKKEKF